MKTLGNNLLVVVSFIISFAMLTQGCGTEGGNPQVDSIEDYVQASVPLSTLALESDDPDKGLGFQTFKVCVSTILYTTTSGVTIASKLDKSIVIEALNSKKFIADIPVPIEDKDGKKVNLIDVDMIVSENCLDSDEPGSPQYAAIAIGELGKQYKKLKLSSGEHYILNFNLQLSKKNQMIAMNKKNPETILSLFGDVIKALNADVNAFWEQLAQHTGQTPSVAGVHGVIEVETESAPPGQILTKPE